MDLKALCKSYQWQGMTIYMLGYRNLEVDIAINDLELIEPHWLYVNTKTGEESANKPQELVQAELDVEERNTKLKLTGKQLKTVKTDWELRNLWNARHNAFSFVLPLIVAIDFPSAAAPSSTEAKIFEAFWNDTTSDFAQRWSNFKRVAGENTLTALLAAYYATRDDVLEAPAALQNEPSSAASEEKKANEPEQSATS